MSVCVNCVHVPLMNYLLLMVICRLLTKWISSSDGDGDVAEDNSKKPGQMRRRVPRRDRESCGRSCSDAMSTINSHTVKRISAVSLRCHYHQKASVPRSPKRDRSIHAVD